VTSVGLRKLCLQFGDSAFQSVVLAEAEGDRLVVAPPSLRSAREEHDHWSRLVWRALTLSRRTPSATWPREGRARDLT
jgi:hypothetical protein